MQKFTVQMALESIGEARAEWAKAKTKFDADVRMVMRRLIMEAAINYMSAEDIAKFSGLTVKQVRLLMRTENLDPRNKPRLLAKRAASTLAENAALLGIEPHEVDLMSPLAYLPAGEALARTMRDRTTSQVTDLPDDEVFVCPVPGCNCDIEARAQGLSL